MAVAGGWVRYEAVWHKVYDVALPTGELRVSREVIPKGRLCRHSSRHSVVKLNFLIKYMMQTYASVRSGLLHMH